MDLGRAGEQLVPAHHPLAQVDLVQPHVGLPDESLLYELAPVGHQEELGGKGHESAFHVDWTFSKEYLDFSREPFPPFHKIIVPWFF